MYEIDGDFGKVRLGNFVFSSRAAQMLMCFSGIGWHKCNELYRISRKDGYHFPLIIFTVGGKGVLKAAENEYTLSAGSVAVIEKDVPHEYFTPHGSEWEFYWIHPSGTVCNMFLSYFLSDLYGERVFMSESIERYTDRVKSLINYLENEKTLSERYVCAEFAQIMYTLINDRGKYKKGQNRLSDEIIGYFERYYNENITIETLSKKFFVSSAHLIRQFKKESGYTPYEYLTLIRVTKACRLLEYTDMSVSEIADCVGIHNTSRFIEKFKAVTSLTPVVYRKTHI